MVNRDGRVVECDVCGRIIKDGERFKWVVVHDVITYEDKYVQGAASESIDMDACEECADNLNFRSSDDCLRGVVLEDKKKGMRQRGGTNGKQRSHRGADSRCEA